MESNNYESICSVCSTFSNFVLNNRSLREGYRCNYCNSILRDRHLVELFLKVYNIKTKSNYTSLKIISESSEIKKIKIYFIGITGPFIKYFKNFENFTFSFYSDNVKNGDYDENGVLCENIENLTFSNDSFDIVISADVMEHVRKPFHGFKEIYRILKPGGYYLYSIPVQLPLTLKESEYRIDTSKEKDIYIKEKVYHGNGKGGKSIVYIDYGIDLINKLLEIGFFTMLYTTKKADTDDKYNPVKNVTFCSLKI